MTHPAQWIGQDPAITRVNNSRRGGRGGAGSLLRRGEHPRFASDGSRADASLLDLALASGFLRRGAEGSLLPGSADEIWREGAPAELAGLALNVLGALLAQAAADEETAEVFPGEHLGTR